MREHPIPQDVTAYRFHIVGNMTIKQFAEVGAGCVLAFVVYSTNLPIILKWPLIAMCVALGAMIAFVPIEERPLDHWVITFFRVLYKPTQFFWKREPKVPDPFLYKNEGDQKTLVSQLDFTPVRRERIREYIGSLRNPLEITEEEYYEQQRIQSIMATFQSTHTEVVESVPVPQKPTLAVRVRDLKQYTEDMETPEIYSDGLIDSFNQQPEVITSVAPILTPPPVIPAGSAAPVSQPIVTAVPTPALVQISIPEPIATLPAAAPVTLNPEPTYVEPVVTVTQTTPAEPVSKLASTGPVVIPQMDAISLEKTHLAELEHQAQVAQAPQSTAAYSTTTAAPIPTQPLQAVQSNAALPFPSRPTEPNKLVGMILSPTNSGIDNAIVEIQTMDGRVARAIKTNVLGQFFVTTPLENNTYTLIVEKPGLQFVPLQITLDGNVVEPLEIRSVA